MNWINVGKLLLIVFGVAFIGMVGFGAYQYYFLKPTPIINNIIQKPEGNVTIQQGTTAQKTKALFTEVYGQLDTDKEWQGGVRLGLRF